MATLVTRPSGYYANLRDYTIISFAPAAIITATTALASSVLSQVAVKAAYAAGAKALEQRAAIPFSPFPELTGQRQSLFVIASIALSILSARCFLGSCANFYKQLVPNAVKERWPVEELRGAISLCEDQGIAFKTNAANLLLMLGYSEPREAADRPFEGVSLAQVISAINKRTPEESLADNQARHLARIALIKELMPDKTDRQKTAYMALIDVLEAKGDKALSLTDHIPALVELMGSSGETQAPKVLSLLVTMCMTNPEEGNNFAKLSAFIKASKVNLNKPLGAFAHIDYEGATPLTFVGYYLQACLQNKTLDHEVKQRAEKLIFLLLSKGAQLSRKDETQGTTLVEIAFSLANDKEPFLLDMLISHPKINLCLKTQSGATPLTRILRNKKWHYLLPKMLRKEKSLLNIEDGRGKTPLMVALAHGVESRNYELFETLLKAGARPNVQNRSGHTALHLVLSRKQIDTYPLGLLLNYGANMYIQDETGMTPQNMLLSRYNVELTAFVAKKSKERRTTGEGRKLGGQELAFEASEGQGASEEEMKKAALREARLKRFAPTNKRKRY